MLAKVQAISIATTIVGFFGLAASDAMIWQLHSVVLDASERMFKVGLFSAFVSIVGGAFIARR